ncbi:uncharacterized protein LOC114537239 [Dendronephthya gigantea]|uniref:uncharacterized protein LOC114537239 n=1 Tax=Dendronephthya gigantea TaxID=151771 RepID=UPI00106B94A4|nr:uncharacterized protein LOC114537239 [Dendronephthya gigantea]
MSKENRITLTSKDGNEHTYENDDESISPKNNLVKAVVEYGNWIIYNTQFDLPKKYKFVTLYGGNGFGQIDNGATPITAVKTINFVADGICLFEHDHFWGKNYTYTDTSSTESEFPTGEGMKGVASIIEFGSSWKLYATDGKTKTISKSENPDVLAIGISPNTIYKVEKL